MALVKNELQSSLLNIQNDPPDSIQTSASRWAELYHSYAMKALAGASLTPVGQNKTIIESSLLSASNGNFLILLGDSITTYWTTTTWISPGFTGITTSATGLTQLLLTSGLKIINYTSTDIVAKELASVLHQHALSIIVSMTNISSGVTLPVSVL